ncbi:neuropilin-1-like [Diadema antillarum]|uniref:neuropilin-1-like n=1 Tax=Diadema antillarum TaxID=105358 RepID=UPI003A8A1646
MPCKNGYCEETMFNYTCHCQPGYTGPHCETGPASPSAPSNATPSLSTTSSPCSPLDAITGDWTGEGSQEIPAFAEALGMENYIIPDSSITASSMLLSNFAPQKARLKFHGGWIPEGLSGNWIQVELENPTCVVGIATQGISHSRPQIWVTEYKVGCGLLVESIVIVTETSSYGVSDKIFSANTDERTVVYNGLPEPHICRFVKVHAVSWFHVPGLRFELYTASVNSETSSEQADWYFSLPLGVP